MRYRTATVEDLPELVRMRWAFRTEDEPPTVDPEDFVRECTAFLTLGLTEGDWVYWVAETEGAIVAHVFVHTIRKVPSPRQLGVAYGYVTNVYTKPEYRNSGVGSALLKKVEEWARQQDLEFLILWPSERSVPFYERAGYLPASDVVVLQLREE